LGELLPFIFELFFDPSKSVTFCIALGSDDEVIEGGSLSPLGCELIQKFLCFGLVRLV